MKRYSFSILLVFLLTIGCQEEISIREGRFRAVIESFQNSVKTAMDEERNVVWSKGDMLAVFQPGTSACKYQVTDASVGKEQGEFIKTGTEGFKVILTNTSNMTTTLEATAENTVSRSTILSMPEVNVGGMTHYTFKESDEIIANPERGFYSARSSRCAWASSFR